MDKMIISAGSYVYVGKRSVNKDNIFFDGKILNITESQKLYKNYINKRLNRFFAFAVCSGSGAGNMGHLAASSVARCFRLWCSNAYRRGIQDWKTDCNLYFRLMNKHFTRISEENDGIQSYSCSLIVFENGTAYFANSSHSSIYLLRSGKIIQLENNCIDDQHNRTGTVALNTNTITQPRKQQPCFECKQSIGIPFKIFPDDVIMICSKRLVKTLSEETIQSIVKKNVGKSLSRTIELLIKAVSKTGVDDNCTVILVRNDTNKCAFEDNPMEEKDDSIIIGHNELKKLILLCVVLTIGIIINLLLLFNLQ